MERANKKNNEGEGKAKKVEDQNTKNEQSYWEMMIDGIVRPPRAKYHTNQLGSKFFSYHDKSYFREEHLIQMEGKKIQLTLYLAQNKSKYIILYMHGNSSCKIQALGLIRYIPHNVSLASFDFMGCGRNQQADTISLGYREAQQAETICKFLEDKEFKVILWGRSMGAATALLYGKAQFIVADSSYKSFKSLCKQVAKQYSPSTVPNFMVTCFFPCVFGKLRKDVDRRAKYDVEQLDVREAVKRLDPKTTVVFMTGQNDNLIHPRNSQKLLLCCPCQKKYLKVFKGDHNSKRPEEVMIQVMKLIQDYINQSTKNELKISPQEIQINLGKQ